MSEPRKKPNKGLRDLLNCRCINEAQRSIVSRIWDTAIISSFALQEQRDLQVGHCGEQRRNVFMPAMKRFRHATLILLA